jgi:hypothetical protein
MVKRSWNRGGECVEGTGGRGEVGEVRWGARRGG